MAPTPKSPSRPADTHRASTEAGGRKATSFLTPEHLPLSDSMQFRGDYSTNIQLLPEYSLSTCCMILRTNNTQTWSPASRSPQPDEGGKTLNH